MPGVPVGLPNSVDIPPWDQAEPDGDGVARRAVYDIRVRPRSRVAREGFKRRVELIERSFAATLERWLLATADGTVRGNSATGRSCDTGRQLRARSRPLKRDFVNGLLCHHHPSTNVSSLSWPPKSLTGACSQGPNWRRKRA